MGAVYRAFDVTLARYVALKVMHRQFASQPQFQQRFMQEAQAIARLSHPSIVVVHNFENKQGFLYIVMEFIRGLSLGTYLKQLAQRGQVVKLDETAVLIAQVADALGYAHRQGVVHRDVKPDNILIKKLDVAERPNEPPLRSIVTDFGLAKLVQGGVETQSGTFMGTLPYMSPEQALAKPVDGRSDIYSLGVVLYQLVTGRPPFIIQTPTEAVLKHLNEIPPGPRELQPGVPPALEQVILKALAKKPEDRYQTAESFSYDLRRAASNLTEKDVTVYATAVSGQVASVVTQLADIEDIRLPSQMGSQFTSTGDVDRLIIAREGDTPRTHHLDKTTLTIGRSKDNDLVLEGDGVSRRHARLERTSTGWRVVDLGSTNGTLLGNKQLPTNGAEAWLPNQVLQIGPFFLEWQPAQRAATMPPPPPVVRPQPPTVPINLPSNYQPPSQQPRPFEQFSCDMRPRTLQNGGVCRILIRNEGNTDTTFTVSARATGDGATFDERMKRVQIAAGQTNTVDFEVQAKNRPFSGRSQTIPFEFQVSATTAPRQSLAGELNIMPVIPGWAPPIFGFVLLLLCVGLFLLYQAINSRNNEISSAQEAITATYVAALTAAAEGTQAAEQSAAGTATALAITAQAAGDSDEDGLSNSQEAVTGTDPNNPDTDGDGLSDGAEVNQYGTAPKNRDTDNDTVSDGDEVNIHKTAPLNPDTDGDGVPDGIEIATGTDPLLPPTATPQPTNTETAVPPSATPTLTVPPSHTPTPTATTNPGGIWHGAWNTQCDYLSCGDMVINHEEGKPTLTGTFGGTGSLSGTIDGNHLVGTWSFSGQSGTIDFWISADGQSWQGNWNKQYSWCGTRTGGAFPAPCGVASWYGQWITSCNDSDVLCGTINLIQDGIQVEGTYADGSGTINGLAQGSNLDGTWFRAGNSGQFTFFMQNDGTQFNGNYNEDFPWCGRRTNIATLPDPCLNQGIGGFAPNFPPIIITLQPDLPFTPILLPTPTP